MNTTMSRGLIRLVAGPIVAASIIGGALGMAAVANASTAGMSIHPHTTTGNTQGGTTGSAGNTTRVHGGDNSAASVDGNSSTASAGGGHDNTATVHGDDHTATVHGDDSAAS